LHLWRRQERKKQEMTEKDENIKVIPSNHDTGIICSAYAAKVPVILQLKNIRHVNGDKDSTWLKN